MFFQGPGGTIQGSSFGQGGSQSQNQGGAQSQGGSQSQFLNPNFEPPGRPGRPSPGTADANRAEADALRARARVDADSDLAAAVRQACSHLMQGGALDLSRGSRDYDEDYQADIDCNKWEIGREGITRKHHVVSHQLHDETKRRRDIPESGVTPETTTTSSACACACACDDSGGEQATPSADALAFAKGCRDRPPRDYHFDDYEDYLVPEKFMLLRDYSLNYPLPDCPIEHGGQEATTPSLPSFSTVNDNPCTIFGRPQPGPPCFFG